MHNRRAGNNFLGVDILQDFKEHDLKTPVRSLQGEPRLPIVSVFYGTIIRMNFADHNPPHFHAEYQGFDAAFDIRSGKLVAGELPKSAVKIIRDWAKAHRADLLRRIPGADQ